MESKIVNQLHLVFEGEEIKTFLDITKKISSKRPAIGLIKSNLDFTRSEIELMGQISERFMLNENHSKE